MKYKNKIQTTYNRQKNNECNLGYLKCLTNKTRISKYKKSKHKKKKKKQKTHKLMKKKNMKKLKTKGFSLQTNNGYLKKAEIDY